MDSGFQLQVAYQPSVGDDIDGGLLSDPLSFDSPSTDGKRVPLVCIEDYHIVPNNSTKQQIQQDPPCPRLALVFCPSTLTENTLENIPTERITPLQWLIDGEQVSRSLLSLIHPFLEHNFAIKAIFRSNQVVRLPADLILLDLSHTPPAAIHDLMESTDNQVIRSGPEVILKVILLQSVVTVEPPKPHGKLKQQQQPPNSSRIIFPSCPVCLHRIDPWRLGLPKPQLHHLCSSACLPLVNNNNNNNQSSCPRQRLLRPWPLPNNCDACGVLSTYWNGNHSFVCEVAGCSMRETLWVCLTCAFVGCGRYSNKHSVQHNTDTGHAFCLELSTCRIWSYEDGEFAHRADLLECSSSLPQPPNSSSGGVARAFGATMDGSVGSTSSTQQSKQAVASPSSSDDRLIAAGIAAMDDKTPKKTTMIGEEYEALLQSALEDQAQHYEGEITRLRANLTEQQLDRDTMTPKEASQIGSLRAEIAQLRSKIEQESRELVELQGQEAGNRAKSQDLLREQGVAQEQLKKLRAENSVEYEKGRMEIEELEQQISDLTANQKMMHEFSRNQSLHNSQILFTAGQPSKQKSKRGTRKSAKKRK